MLLLKQAIITPVTRTVKRKLLALQAGVRSQTFTM
jgi:hypothetical protein